MTAFVYIMASQRNGTLYIGATVDVAKRANEHRDGIVAGFTKRYDCKLLVWFEPQETMEEARVREKQLKEWRRAWKIEVIEAMNPMWHDLAEQWRS